MVQEKGGKSRRGGAKSNEVDFQGRVVEEEGSNISWSWEARTDPSPSPACGMGGACERERETEVNSLSSSSNGSKVLGQSLALIRARGERTLLSRD